MDMKKVNYIIISFCFALLAACSDNEKMYDGSTAIYFNLSGNEVDSHSLKDALLLNS